MKRRTESAVLYLFAYVGLVISCCFAAKPTPVPVTLSSIAVLSSADAVSTGIPHSSSPVPTPSLSPSVPSPSLSPSVPSPSPSSTVSSSSSSSGSSQPSPSSTPTPSPTPPSTPIYTLMDSETNGTCIMMRANISLSMYYTTWENSSTERATFLLSKDDGMEAMVDVNRSHCTHDVRTANLTILWTTPSDVKQYLSFKFEQRRYNWRMSAIRQILNVTEEDFRNISEPDTTITFSDDETFFINEYQRSYKCDEQSYRLDSINNTVIKNITLELRSWQVQAMEFRQNNMFGNARECPQDAEKNIKLPIIVGCLLAVFLTAVIVVYILSRFRKRRLRYYESLN